MTFPRKGFTMGRTASSATLISLFLSLAASQSGGLAQPIAYVLNADAVSVIDTATSTVIGSIEVGGAFGGIAITPDGSRAYVTGDATVSVIDIVENRVLGNPIRVVDSLGDIAITPDGSRAYMIQNGDNPASPGSFIYVIDTNPISQTFNTVIGNPIRIGERGNRIAITPDGSRAYVTNGGFDFDENTVTVIDTAKNTVIGSPIGVGRWPKGIAIIPDGSRGYVANEGSNTVSIIDTNPDSQTFNKVISTIRVGQFPISIAFTPDGSRAYVTNLRENTVCVIDTAKNTVIGNPIGVGEGPNGVAITPDGSRAYITNRFYFCDVDGTVSIIDTNPNSQTFDTVLGNPIRVGAQPRGIAIGQGTTTGPQIKFHRGDADSNGQLQLTDAVRILGFLFLGQAPPTCLDAADADDNGVLQLTDAVRILGFLFLGQASPAPPGPPDEPCGTDVKIEAPDLGCESYDKC